MASKHLLKGLIKSSMRDRWRDRFDQILEDHLLPACDETGVATDDVVSIMGEDLFMSTVWACAFEDFLTREFEDGANVVDEYLKRRGWKEPASVRTYMAALRNSTMSVYEVSDIVPGESFRARDLVRGGEPVLISEKSATRSLKPWDRMAARVVDVGSKMQIGGGVLLLQMGIAEACIEALHELRNRSTRKQREFSKAMRQIHGDSAVAELASTDELRAPGPMFTTFWLVDLLKRTQEPKTPDLRNFEGDQLLLCEARYPFAAGTTCDQIGAVLDAHREFRRADATFWNWVSLKKSAARSSQGSLTFETRIDDGTLVLGGVELKADALVLSVNSRRRCELGCTLLSAILGERVRPPLLKTETVDQMMASPRTTAPQQLDIPEEERCAIVHDCLDRHYKDVLDRPVPMLGGKSPRAAVRTESGRIKVAGWLKMMENTTAKAADYNKALAIYDFGWLWNELGIDELRR
ncbi:MAG: hypothetical protein QOJ86_457 [Bradyrhizobium sp.]|nr:hypothetical protein [Bradyrhizobium sp.]